MPGLLLFVCTPYLCHNMPVEFLGLPDEIFRHALDEHVIGSQIVRLCVTPLIDSLEHVDGFLGIASYVTDSAEPLLQRTYPRDLPLVLETIQTSREQRCKWQQKFRVFFPDGSMHWLSASAIPERLTDGTVLWSGFTSDVTERKLADEQLIQASLHDPLTGLHNRLFGDMEISRLRSGRRFPLSILIIDLDGLKFANDNYGHAIGDPLIQAAANVMKACFRPEDLIASMGGDEFLIILPDSSDENTAFAMELSLAFP